MVCANATKESATVEINPAGQAQPGPAIRDALKAAGYSIPAAAVAICVNRANLNNVILGKTALSHDMAYRLNVLVSPDDQKFAFARQLLSMQLDHAWNEGAPSRSMARVVVEAGRKYGDLVERGETAHLTLTAAGERQRRLDQARYGKSPLG